MYSAVRLPPVFDNAVQTFQTMNFRFTVIIRAFLLLLCGALFPVTENLLAVDAKSDTARVERLGLKPAPVVLWNRTIVIFRKAYEEITPQERAKYAIERMNQMPANFPEYRVAAVDVLEGGKRISLIRVNGRIMFSLIEGEEDAANGETFERYKENSVKAVSAWFASRKAQYALPLLLRAIGFSFLATILCAFAVFAIKRANRRVLKFVRSFESVTIRHFIIAGTDISPYLFPFLAGLLKIVEGVVLVSIGYLWVIFLLSLFPYTAPWAGELTGFLVIMLAEFGNGVLISIPELFAVVVIFLVTRLLVRGITAFFRAIEDDTITLSWFEPETAKATRRIVVVLVWIFALIIAYPLIPGSQTKVFQGVSVFLGLMLSLGSAGLVGQLVGGIVAVYTRAFQAGDYVRIGEHEGVVQELGLLAAKIVTIRKEEITIPNALLMSSTTVNYTRQSRSHGAVVATGVTIGYDAPWRQVHAMLEMAAERTQGVLESPGPIVLQKALSDFYVEYTLMTTIERPEKRYYILSDLHGHIQDVFNEYGVQIMSPNFRSQPHKAVVVPKELWYAKPAQERPADG